MLMKNTHYYLLTNRAEFHRGKSSLQIDDSPSQKNISSRIDLKPKQSKSQEWEERFGVGDGEGCIHFLPRLSLETDPFWAPIAILLSDFAGQFYGFGRGERQKREDELLAAFKGKHRALITRVSRAIIRTFTRAVITFFRTRYYIFLLQFFMIVTYTYRLKYGPESKTMWQMSGRAYLKKEVGGIESELPHFALALERNWPKQADGGRISNCPRSGMQTGTFLFERNRWNI